MIVRFLWALESQQFPSLVWPHHREPVQRDVSTVSSRMPEETVRASSLLWRRWSSSGLTPDPDRSLQTGPTQLMTCSSFCRLGADTGRWGHVPTVWAAAFSTKPLVLSSVTSLSEPVAVNDPDVSWCTERACVRHVDKCLCTFWCHWQTNTLVSLCSARGIVNSSMTGLLSTVAIFMPSRYWNLPSWNEAAVGMAAAVKTEFVCTCGETVAHATFSPNTGWTSGFSWGTPTNKRTNQLKGCLCWFES